MRIVRAPFERDIRRRRHDHVQIGMLTARHELAAAATPTRLPRLAQQRLGEGARGGHATGAVGPTNA